MPQLWLTYQEMADEFGRDVSAVREAVHVSGWTRKRSRDGLTRVLMPAATMQAYFANAAQRTATLDVQADAMVTHLRAVTGPAVVADPARRDGRAA